MFNKEQGPYKVLRGILKERTRPTLAWIGAGLSAAAGLPTWPRLVEGLQAALHEKIISLGDAGESLRGKLLASKEHTNPWEQLQILKDGLGPATYEGQIRMHLAQADRVDPPRNYHRIWRLGVRGVLNVNLDKLATRAFTKCFPERDFVEFQGLLVGGHFGVFQSQKPFLVNLHGDKENANYWVLTARELDALLSKPEYLQFVRSCITQHSIIFFGISVTDVAISRHFEVLKSEGLSNGEHFWITDSRDAEVDRWAERNGIQPIFYDSSDGSHGDLDELLDDLERFVSPEQIAPPAFEAPIPGSVEPISEGALDQLGTEELRIALNRRAEGILGPGDHAAYVSYESFVKDHEELIHRACFVPNAPSDYRLLGFKLYEQIGEGAFGSVFRAVDEFGNRVAVKVLHDKVRRNGEMLQSFRRGVRSMRILARHGVEGMVPYRRASEIPPLVAMDFVDGWNLQSVVEARYLSEWDDVLRFADELAQIIKTAHALPERVLHRDLRPSNIMLEGFLQGQDPWKVMVLDFDLSWHLDAMEISISSAHSATGYLAPEQLLDRPGVSRRNAAVDSFGFGMTLFFVLARRSPRLGEQSQIEWRGTLEQIATSWPCRQWQSLPRRMVRLLYRATQDIQSKRPDMHQVAAEIARLRSAFLGPEKVDATELIAEEFLCRVRGAQGYEWDSDRGCGTFELASGASVAVSSDEARHLIKLVIGWQSAGLESRKRIGKYVVDVEAQCSATLRRAGWRVVSSIGTNNSGLTVSAECPAPQVAERVAASAAVVERAVALFSFQ